ncbi:MAG: sugar ABC transporter substrate-binding protein [Verrucomicrobia bacterium]|nr:sugar ABC transporter substrate-binding protein [Verrucomicrobiota bacterium]MBV9275579.1 sugar ABC transporter substrate-binding protein [Verrucomicrobiota bacterium]
MQKNKMIKAHSLITRLTLAALLTAGLITTSPCDAAGQKHYKIGFMIWNASIPFYSNLIKGARETADKLGVSLDIQSGNGELATEVAVVQQFMAKRVDMILLTPSDAKGIVPVVRQATAAGIPVMAVNNRVDTSSGAKVVTYVGVDDVNFGRQQGELLASAVGSRGKVAYIMGKLGTSAQIDRRAGLMEALKKYPDIQILQAQSADWDNAKALAVTQDFLSRYPKGSLDAIICQGPEGVTGASFAKQSGRTDVKFILGDYPADVRNAIMSGTVYGTVDQDPMPQGVNAVEDAVKWLDGKTSEVQQPNHYLPLPIVTKDNVDKFPPAWGG